ncbi:DUF397 domain-containing protein [Actinomadura atramentaria]|uniref:DUF397 domain-containing protein n=1 Tax=Actinomadura atramentaria TaxID=1990 RepID=UPI0003A12DA9|nr:DUF397 domain-containing protein [Actinomadura atramentaria]
MTMSAWRKSTYSGTNGNCLEVATWRRSSHSGNGGNCVEVAAWRKSSHSSRNGDCVEAATVGALHLARDSKNPAGPVLAFDRSTWAAFLDNVKSGDFDLG